MKKRLVFIGLEDMVDEARELVVAAGGLVCVDLDGVVADFVGAACKLHGQTTGSARQWNFWESWGLTASQFWAPIHERGADFWASIPPTGEFAVQHVIDGAPCCFLSDPGDHPCAAEGKRMWVRDKYGDADRLVLASDKSLMAAPGRVLIDDYLPNCVAFVEAGGSAILWEQPWSRLEAAS